MRVQLTQTYFWDRAFWGPGETEVSPSLALALGLLPTQAPAPTALENPQAIAETLPPALRLINSSDKATDLEIITTVGRGAAKKLIAKRPEGGFTSLDQVQQLCPEIFQPPFTGDLDEIANWGTGA